MLSLWDNWGDERGCDEGQWHAHTKGFPRGLPEVVGTVEEVYYSRKRLPRRGLEFHVCTINKSVHTKKVWKLIVCTTYIISAGKQFLLIMFINELKLILLHSVKSSKYFLFNSINHLSFVYTQLNIKAVQVLTIQFNICFSVKQFYLTHK